MEVTLADDGFKPVKVNIVTIESFAVSLMYAARAALEREGRDTSNFKSWRETSEEGKQFYRYQSEALLRGHTIMTYHLIGDQ